VCGRVCGRFVTRRAYIMIWRKLSTFIRLRLSKLNVAVHSLSAATFSGTEANVFTKVADVRERLRAPRFDISTKRLVPVSHQHIGWNGKHSKDEWILTPRTRTNSLHVECVQEPTQRLSKKKWQVPCVALTLLATQVC